MARKKASDVADQLMSVLDQQDQARDAIVEDQAPTGRFSQLRVDTVIGVVNELLALLGSPTQVAPVKVTTDRPFTLPMDLVKGLALVKNMIKDYTDETSEPVRDFEISAATKDGDLALVALSIRELLKSAAFKRWLRTERKPEPTETEDFETGMEGMDMSPPSSNIDLMLLK